MGSEVGQDMQGRILRDGQGNSCIVSLSHSYLYSDSGERD